MHQRLCKNGKSVRANEVLLSALASIVKVWVGKVKNKMPETAPKSKAKIGFPNPRATLTLFMMTDASKKTYIGG